MDLSAQGTDPEETVVVKEHKRTRKKKSVRDDLYALLPIRDIKCDVPESERFCPDCDAPMEHLGYKTVREELSESRTCQVSSGNPGLSGLP